MFMTLVLITTVLLATLSLPAALHAQSLADVAKKSEAQRGKGEATSDAKAGNPTSIGSAGVGAQLPKASTSVSFPYVVDLVKFLAGDGRLLQVAAQGKTKPEVNKTDPVYGLPLFPVRAVLLKLPPYQAPYTMTLTTYLGGFGRTKHILIPSGGDLFDADFNFTRKIVESAFRPKAPAFTTGTGVEASIPFENAQRDEAFLILYVDTRTAGIRVPIEWSAGSYRSIAPLLIRAERSDAGTIEVEIHSKQ
jgi:hypothetical protein